ncbi:MAG: HPr family phosphocarrier protein [Negativicutes bacterium]|jgi:phosphocarrier protein
MTEQATQIKNSVGLHARPASMVVKEAGTFKCTVELVKAGKAVNAKSILSIMGAGIKAGEEIIIRADGEGEAEAVAAIVKLIESGFGEH